MKVQRKDNRVLRATAIATSTLALLLVAGLLLAIPGTYASTAVATPAQSSGTWPPLYRVGMYGDLTTTNYWAHMGPSFDVHNSYVLGQAVHTLFTLSDRHQNLVPRLAADFGSAPVEQGGLWVIEVPLRQGIEWSNGTLFTAGDVVFTLQTCKDLELGQRWAKVCPDSLDHVEADGNYVVKFFFTHAPGISEWQASVAQMPVLPRHYWEPVVQEALTQPDPSGYLYNHVPRSEPVLGPFRLTEWAPGNYATLVVNGRYSFQGLEITEYANGAYREVLPGKYTFEAYGPATGPVDLTQTVGPYVGGVEYTIYASIEAAYQGLMDSAVDYVLGPSSIPSAIRDALALDPDVALVENPDHAMFYMAFNMRHWPMVIPEYRQAVALLTDREFPGSIVPQDTDPLYTFVPEVNDFWYNPAAPRVGEGLTREQRINETLALLPPAGFGWIQEPAWDPVGQQVIPGRGLYYFGSQVPEIELLAPNFDFDPVRATQALSIGQWLNEAGISVTVVLADFDSIVDAVWDSTDFDAYILGWSLGDTAFPAYFDDFWHSRNDTLTSGNNNTPGYTSPTYDLLCESFMSTSDLGQAQADAFQMQVQLGNDLPYLTLHTRQVFDAYLHGRITYPYTDTLSGLEYKAGMPALVQFAPVVESVDPAGDSFQVPLASMEVVFPFGTVTQMVIVSTTLEAHSDTGTLVAGGPAFDLSAVYASTGQPAGIVSGSSYQVSILYGPSAAVEDTLGLYWWDERVDAWSQEGIVNHVDTANNTVMAEVNHFSRFALLGEPLRIYLPLVIRDH